MAKTALAEFAQNLADGKVTSRSLVEAYLAAIADPRIAVTELRDYGAD